MKKFFAVLLVLTISDCWCSPMLSQLMAREQTGRFDKISALKGVSHHPLVRKQYVRLVTQASIDSIPELAPDRDKKMSEAAQDIANLLPDRLTVFTPMVQSAISVPLIAQAKSVLGDQNFDEPHKAVVAWHVWVKFKKAKKRTQNSKKFRNDYKSGFMFWLNSYAQGEMGSLKPSS